MRETAIGQSADRATGVNQSLGKLPAARRSGKGLAVCVDGSFSAGLGAERRGAVITQVIPRPDGKVLVAGAFSSVNREARRGLAVLNVDGSTDLGFVPALDSTGQAVDNAGRVFITQAIPARNVNVISRLTAIGAPDATFASAELSFAESLFAQPDGKLLVGSSSTAPPPAVSGLLRFNLDASDCLFAVGSKNACFCGLIPRA